MFKGTVVWESVMYLMIDHPPTLFLSPFLLAFSPFPYSGNSVVLGVVSHLCPRSLWSQQEFCAYSPRLGPVIFITTCSRLMDLAPFKQCPCWQLSSIHSTNTYSRPALRSVLVWGYCGKQDRCGPYSHEG